jgi:hypothetical protein
LEKFTNQYKFIKNIIDGTIKIFNKKKEDIEKVLVENGFKKYEEIFPEKESVLEVKNNSQDDENDQEEKEENA